MMYRNSTKLLVAVLPLLLISCGGGGGSSSSSEGGENCNNAIDEVNKYLCFTRLAQNSKSLSFCDKIPADFCWTGNERNSAIGNVRDNCYATTAHFIGDPSVCGLIKNEVSACLADDILTRWKDLCYEDLARVVNDPGVCGK